MLKRLNRRLRNLYQTNWKWSFETGKLEQNRGVVAEGEVLTLSGAVKNNGLCNGTVYVRILAADSYHLDDVVFDSHRDLPENIRQSLRIVSIDRAHSRRFSCSFILPAGLEHQHIEVRVQIWNPHFLFGGPAPFLFFDTGWHGGFEVVSKVHSSIIPRVFISYSWDSNEHKKWVRELAEELSKYDMEVILDQSHILGGDETTRFMEQGITEATIRLLVCTENYTIKANGRVPGGVGYETIITTNEYQQCAPEERARFIPVIRSNSLPKGKKLPIYLGSSLYIDMDGEDWRADPMQHLVKSIKRHF
jgi:hypothetical protein